MSVSGARSPAALRQSRAAAHPAELHAGAGAYALHALPVDERVAFRRHLDECCVCRTDVAELQATAARLAVVAAEPPPQALRHRLLASAETTRQVTPAPSPPRAWSGDRAAPQRALGTVAALLAVAVLVVGGVAVRLSGQVDRLQVALDAARGAGSVVTAPGARTIPLRGAGDTAGRLVLAGDDRAVLVTDNLGAPPPAAVYEMWVIRGERAEPAGVFMPDAQGHAMAQVEASLQGADAIAVTMEPAPGSPTPEGAQVLSGALPA